MQINCSKFPQMLFVFMLRDYFIPFLYSVAEGDTSVSFDVDY